MRALKILSCNDQRKWYADFVGGLVPFLSEEQNEWRSLERCGFVNFVSKSDAELVVLDKPVKMYEV